MSKDVLAFDRDVSEIDPDPVQHTPVLRNSFVPLGHHILHRDRALDCIDHRGKLKQQAVSRALHEATSVFRHESFGNHAAFAEGASGTDLVEPHEPRVTGDVSCDYGGEPASDTGWLLRLHTKLTPLA